MLVACLAGCLPARLLGWLVGLAHRVSLLSAVSDAMLLYLAVSALDLVQRDCGMR